MITLTPPAWMGYKSNEDGSFSIRVCLLCDGLAQAISESKPFIVVKTVCAKHAYENSCARLGEQAT